MSSDQGKPGDQVSITVSTKPNSYVGLLGVDQSVLLLKKGNDLDKSAVFEELGKFNERTRWERRFYGSYYGSYADFDSSGAAIITNAKEEIRKLFSKKTFDFYVTPQFSIVSTSFFIETSFATFQWSSEVQQIYYHMTSIGEEEILQDFEEFAVPESIDRLDGPESYDGPTDIGSASEPVTRKDFPETWIWDSIDG